MELLDCPLCLFLMCEPVSLSCGHTFCRRCVAGCFLPAKCPLCHDHGGHTFSQREVKSSRNNVLLISVVEKCCPGQTKTWSGVQDKLKAGEFTEALHIVNQGLDLVPDDVSLKALRAEANMGMLRHSDALTDLHYLCCLRPNWTEGFFRKGNVLLAMGQQTQALVQFHRCLNLQADFTPAKSQIKKVLEAEGVSVPDELSSLIQLLGEYLKEPCTITSLSVSQGPAHPQGPTQQHGDQQQMKQESECCLSLCQAVSFLPAAEDHHDMMEDGHGRGESSHHGDKPLSVLSASDFECPLCIRLFYEPVTTPCGHTFCKNCIERSLDHNLRCPLCKQPLQEYLKSRKYNPTALLQDIMSRLFSSQLAERKHIHETEMAELSNLTKDIPIFVCTVAYPGVPCPLHIFEPRYRLMMRRCMETGTKKFGMCSYEHGKGFADYGCMLEIHSLELLADGRSFVDTTGGSRFKVLRRAQRDGYHTADIEYLEDLKVEGSELELLQHLHASVYQQAQDWYQRIGSRIPQQIDRQYGTMPETEENIQASSSGPAWCWWLLSVLQLDPAYQTTVLSLTSLKERLGHLRLVLEYFSQSES